MMKCLYCLKYNEEAGEECQFCHKPLSATNGLKPMRTAAAHRPAKPPVFQAHPGAPTQPDASSHSCPFCNRSDGMWEKAKMLYGVPVCKKCSNDFTNRRFLAYVIDSVAWTFFPVFFIGTLQPFIPRQILVIPAILLIVFGFLLKDGFKGKSMGKAILGLQVLNTQTGRPIGMGGSIIRNLPFYIPFAPLMIAFSFHKGPRIGDSWAKTKVVWTKQLGKGPFSEFLPGEEPIGTESTYSSRLGKV